jgi:hypothetical protein
VTTAAQIVLGLQTVVSRRTDLMKSPTVVSVTMINGGSRFNIVPDSVDLGGTIRTYDADIRAAVHRDIRQIAENIAASANAKAEVEIIELYDPLVNNEQMTARMAPVLERAADGDAGLNERSGASEDVSFFLNEVPGLYFNLGIVPSDQDLAKAAPNQSELLHRREGTGHGRTGAGYGDGQLSRLGQDGLALSARVRLCSPRQLDDSTTGWPCPVLALFCRANRAEQCRLSGVGRMRQCANGAPNAIYRRASASISVHQRASVQAAALPRWVAHVVHELMHHWRPTMQRVNVRCYASREAVVRHGCECTKCIVGARLVHLRCTLMPHLD